MPIIVCLPIEIPMPQLAPVCRDDGTVLYIEVNEEASPLVTTIENTIRAYTDPYDECLQEGERELWNSGLNWRVK